MRIEIGRLTLSFTGLPRRGLPVFPAGVARKESAAAAPGTRQPYARAGLEAEALANEKLVQAGRMATVAISGRGPMLQRRDAAGSDSPTLAERIASYLTTQASGDLRVRLPVMSTAEITALVRKSVSGADLLRDSALQKIIEDWRAARTPSLTPAGPAPGAASTPGSRPSVGGSTPSGQSPLGGRLGDFGRLLGRIPTSVALGDPRVMEVSAGRGGLQLSHERPGLKLSAGIGWDRVLGAEAAVGDLKFTASADILGSEGQKLTFGLQYGPDAPDLAALPRTFQPAGEAAGHALVNLPRFVSYLREGGVDELKAIPDAVEQARRIAGERDRKIPITFGLTAEVNREGKGPPGVSVMGNLTFAWDVLKKAKAGADPASATSVAIPRGAGQPLDSKLLEKLEGLFGRQLPDVRIHTGPAAEAAAAGLKAEAFTRGHDIYFGEGKFAPESKQGLGLLGHELTHVLQQEEGRATGVRRAGADTGSLEREAETIARAVQTASSTVRGGALIIGAYRRTYRPADGQPLANTERAALDTIATQGREACERILQAEHPSVLTGNRTLPPLSMSFDVDLASADAATAAQAWGRKMAQTIVAAAQAGAAGVQATQQQGTLLLKPDPQAPPVPAVPAPAPAAGVTPPSPPAPMSDDEQRRVNAIITATPAEKELVRKLSIRPEVKKLQAEVDRLETYQNVTPDDPTAGQNNKRIAEANKRVIKERLDSVGLNAIEDLEPLTAQLRDMFKKKGFDLTIFMLEQNEKIAKKEIERYVPSEGGNPDSDMAKLKAAAADIASQQPPLIARLKELSEQVESMGGPSAGPINSSTLDTLLTGEVARRDPKIQTELLPPYEKARQTHGGDFSVLLARGLDYAALAAADPKQTGNLVTQKAQEVLRNIQQIKNDMEPDKVWELPRIIAQTKQVLGIRAGEGADAVIQEYLKDKAFNAALWNAISAAAAIALGIVAITATGGLATLALVGAGAISAYSAATHLGEYNFGSAALGSALDPAAAISEDEPSLFWLAVDLIGAGLDVGAAFMAFKNLAKTALAAMRTEEALKELETAARSQYKLLASKGHVAVSEEAFVKRLVESARKGATGTGEAAIRQFKIIKEIVEGTSPRVIRLLNGEGAALEELIKEHGNWKGLIEALMHGGPDAEKVANNLGKFRNQVVADLEKFGAKPVGGASTTPISDVDLNVAGEDAGKTLLKLEDDMAKRFGPGWSEALHMNFYTEAGRLIQYEEIMKLLSPGARQALLSRMSQLTERFTFAKMLEHAGEDKEAIRRVEELIKSSGKRYSLDDLRKLSKVDHAARRAELLAKIDDEVKAFNQLKPGDTAGRARQAQRIAEMQMEANFYSKEAYMGPGAVRMTVQGVAVKGHEAYQAALSNLEMIEHIIGQANGDVVRACREYEVFKYVNRYTQAAGTAGVKSPALTYFENLSEYIYRRARGAHGELAHVPAPGKVLDEASEVKVTDDFLRQQYGMFQNEAHSSLPKIRKAAEANAAAWTPTTKTVTPAAGAPPKKPGE